jgi:hypothetical protein
MAFLAAGHRGDIDGRIDGRIFWNWFRQPHDPTSRILLSLLPKNLRQNSAANGGVPGDDFPK